ncbi:MAG: sugar-binding transcriptional regulator [Cellulosilyticum sp.]|nr:sugar-binding transcriptional regulator [Cellulosilyticum sp.]
MQSKIVALEKLLPEFTPMFKMRYMILQKILKRGPIGRRALGQELILSERTIRAEVEQLENQGLIYISTKGMTITPLGEEILSGLYMSYHALDELSRLEEEIVNALSLKKAIIVKGRLEQNDAVGIAFGSLLEELLKEGDTLAITGGTTIAKMVDDLPRMAHAFKNLHVLPARGSVGERVELHANTIAVKLAEKLEAKYEVLTIPDNLSHQSLHFIKNEPQIQKILQKLSETDMIIFGIGNAMKMAKHRKEVPEVLGLLESKKAISESFRHYFNAKGEVVYGQEVIGVSPSMAKSIPYRIAIAGGKEKAEAILATKALLEEGYLILDEDAARAIIDILNSEQ